METALTIDVAALDTPHRRALEDVIGRELAASQRLLISVIDVSLPADAGVHPPQSLADWTGILEGLADVDIETVDQIAKTRADLSRPLP